MVQRVPRASKDKTSVLTCYVWVGCEMYKYGGERDGSGKREGERGMMDEIDDKR